MKGHSIAFRITNTLSYRRGNWCDGRQLAWMMSLRTVWLHLDVGRDV